MTPCEPDNSISFRSDSLPFLRSILNSRISGRFARIPIVIATDRAVYSVQRYLPKLLDWGHAHPEVRTPLRLVAGIRGQWLARLNPKWAYAQATPEAPNPEDWQSLWETSNRIVRLNLLQEWRSQNAEVARELLAQHMEAREPQRIGLRF